MSEPETPNKPDKPETPNKPDKPETPQESVSTDPITIQVDSDDIDEEHPVIKKLLEINQSLKSEIDELKEDNTKSKKQVYIDKLVAAGYGKQEDLQEISLESLRVTTELLSTKDGRIIIPKRSDTDQDTKDPLKKPPTTVYIPGKGMVDFWDHFHGRSSESSK